MRGFLKEIVKRLRQTRNFTCDICGEELFDRSRICKRCFDALERITLCCPFCGRKVREAGTCTECKDRPLAVHKCRSVCTHEGEAARLVLRYKNGEQYLSELIADLMTPLCLQQFSDADALVYVPMTDAALRRRGFCQTRLLAEKLSERTQKPVLHAVTKERETAAQKTLSRRLREKNVKGCFHVSDRAAVKGKTLLIIDDTMTTGATVHALADALLRAKAKRVYALTMTSVEYDLFSKH